MTADLLKVNEFGLYCAAGDFYIDPWRSVPKALITHGHSDHARYGCSKYLSVNENKWILKARLGNQIDLTCLTYGESILINGIKVTFHPSGHLLGGSQIEVEQKGNIWVVSGDYKPKLTQHAGNLIPLNAIHSSANALLGYLSTDGNQASRLSMKSKIGGKPMLPWKHVPYWEHIPLEKRKEFLPALANFMARFLFTALSKKSIKLTWPPEYPCLKPTVPEFQTIKRHSKEPWLLSRQAP